MPAFMDTGGLLNESCLVSGSSLLVLVRSIGCVRSLPHSLIHSLPHSLIHSLHQFSAVGSAEGNVLTEGVLNHRLRRMGATVGPWDFGGFVLPFARKMTIHCASCENASLAACMARHRDRRTKQPLQIFRRGEDPASRRKTRGMGVVLSH